MNIIANQPINNIYRTNNISANNRPAFTAKPKVPTGAEIKKGANFVQKIYGMLFVPFGEKVKMVKDGHIFTESKCNNPHVIFAKKYKLWSKEPEMTVRNNIKTGIQTKAVHKGEVNDIEIADLHTPGHKVSVGYKDVSKEFNIYTDESSKFWCGDEYKGDINIKYGDKEFKVSDAERERIQKEFEDSITPRYDHSISELTGLGYEKFQEYLTKYYQDPEVIGHAILSSPAKLEHQVHTIPSSMPYGIEEIMKHLK